MSPLKISVIIGSTRPSRFSEKPAQWIMEEAKKLENVEVELLDLRDFPMPFYEEATTPTMSKGVYPNPVVKKWAEKIAAADAFIIVSPEYNHGYPAVLKNAMDYVYYEWNNKAVGFVSYGSVGGGRGVEQLRLVSIELQMAPVRSAVHLPGHVVFPIIMGKAEWDPSQFEGAAKTMLGQLTMWGNALKAAREQNPA